MRTVDFCHALATHKMAVALHARAKRQQLADDPLALCAFENRGFGESVRVCFLHFSKIKYVIRLKLRRLLIF